MVDRECVRLMWLRIGTVGLMNAVINFWAPQNTAGGLICSSRMTLLQSVSYFVSWFITTSLILPVPYSSSTTLKLEANISETLVII